MEGNTPILGFFYKLIKVRVLRLGCNVDSESSNPVSFLIDPFAGAPWILFVAERACKTSTVAASRLGNGEKMTVTWYTDLSLNGHLGPQRRLISQN